MLDYFRSLLILKSRKDEEGASAVEYGLLVALIAAVIVLVVLALGGVLQEAFQDTCDSIEAGTTHHQRRLLLSTRSEGRGACHRGPPLSEGGSQDDGDLTHCSTGP